jgi:MFS family permease
MAFPKYRGVWFMSMFFALGNWAARLAIGWVVLEETDSVFLAAATFAVRQAPQLVVSPIAGAVADRFHRGRVLFAFGVMRFGVLGAMAYVAANGLEPLWLIFALLAFSGVVGSFELPAMQGLITGSVPRKLRMNAIAVQSTGTRALGALGALGSGFAIDSLGVPTTLVGAAAMFVVGSVLALFVSRGIDIRQRVQASSVVGDVIDGLVMMWQLPVVRTVLIAAIVVEIFGFAFGSVMPSIARDALGVDVKGLGTLSLMLGIGSMFGTVFLTMLGNFSRKGLLLIFIAVFYGIFIATFSASGSFAIALVLIVGVGASAAAFDAMQWTLLQLNVPDDMRGRAIGGWSFAIGFGWVGHLGLGAASELVGVQWALAGAGLIVVITGLLAFLAAPSLRRA